MNKNKEFRSHKIGNFSSINYNLADVENIFFNNFNFQNVLNVLLLASC